MSKSIARTRLPSRFILKLSTKISKLLNYGDLEEYMHAYMRAAWDPKERDAPKHLFRNSGGAAAKFGHVVIYISR